MSRIFTESKEYQSVRGAAGGFPTDYDLLPGSLWNQGSELVNPVNGQPVNPDLYTRPFRSNLSLSVRAWRVIAGDEIPNSPEKAGFHYRGLTQSRLQLIIGSAEDLTAIDKKTKKPAPVSLAEYLTESSPAQNDDDRIDFGRFDQVRLKAIPPAGFTMADKHPSTVLLSPSIHTPEPLGGGVDDLWSVHYRFFLAYTKGTPRDPMVMVKGAGREYGAIIDPTRILVESVFLKPFREGARYPIAPHLEQSTATGDRGREIDLSWMGPLGGVVAEVIEDIATWKIFEALTRSDD